MLLNYQPTISYSKKYKNIHTNYWVIILASLTDKILLVLVKKAETV